MLTSKPGLQNQQRGMIDWKKMKSEFLIIVNNEDILISKLYITANTELCNSHNKL